MYSHHPDEDQPSSPRAHQREVPFAPPDASTPTGQRLLHRLQEELFIWLTTVDAQGIPHCGPVPFVWDQAHGSLLIYSAPEQHRNRLRHIRHNPNVGVHFDLRAATVEALTSTIIFTGEAFVSVDDPPSDQVQAWIEKYQEFVSRMGLTIQQAAAVAPVAVRIRPLTMEVTSFG